MVRGFEGISKLSGPDLKRSSGFFKENSVEMVIILS